MKLSELKEFINSLPEEMKKPKGIKFTDEKK